MTLYQKLSAIKGKEIAIHCPEEWTVDKLIDSEIDCKMLNCYSYYRKNTCYDFSKDIWSFTALKWYVSEGFKVIEFTEFVADIDEVIKN